jgi:hypothetical protein
MISTEEMNEHAKAVLDTASIGTLIATIAGWLPSISTLFTIVWVGIRIWETETVRRWTGRL